MLKTIVDIDKGLFDGVAIEELVAIYGTPFFVYSQSQLEKNLRKWQRYKREQDTIYYAVKANHNLSILKLISEAGFGFDTVSKNEINRLAAIGVPMHKIIFSGVAKTEEELQLGCHRQIASINIESESEFYKLANISQQCQFAVHCAIRVNPDITVETHGKIATGHADSKFGVMPDLAMQLIEQSQQYPNLNVTALSSHIGSQVQDLSKYTQLLTFLIDFANQLKNNGFAIQTLNIGGGFSVNYRQEKQFEIKTLLQTTADIMQSQPYHLAFEPGRSIVANSGYLLTKVQHIKQSYGKNYALVDAGMNNFMRPTLYNAYHKMSVLGNPQKDIKNWQIAGPICESGDFFGRNRRLDINPNSLIVIHDCGAYGSVMNNNYNSHLLCPEILVCRGKHRVIRQQQSFQQMIDNELPFV